MNQSTPFAQVATNQFDYLSNALCANTPPYKKHSSSRKFLTLSISLRLLLVMFLTLTVSANVWGATYKLTKVTSVSAGEKYVFEQDGYVMNNTTSSSALQCTNSYKTTGLAGTETYVWTLESANGGFYMRNVNLESNYYLKNSSSTGVSLTTTSSIWKFTFDDSGIVLIQNTGNSNRFLGYTSATSYAYKAYATSNLSSYPHAITVYKLEEEVPSCTNKVTIQKGTDTNGTFTLSKTGTYETCDAPLVITLSNITPSDGYQFSEITQSGINSGVTIDQANKTVTYAQNTSGTSTINVTFTALETHSVTWKVNGENYTDGSPTTQVYDGGKVTKLPTAPDPANNCGEVFAGWTTTPIDRTTNTKPSVLFTTAANSPAITGDVTFYAVFADYAD